MKTPRKAGAKKASSNKALYRRIAVEEAFSIPEQMDAMRAMAAGAQEYDPDLFLWKVMSNPDGPVHARLLDLDDERLRIMDRDAVAVHVLSLTSTGVQMLDAGRGTALAMLANDRLADAVRRHPDRYAGLATLAPQDPARAAKEAERAINKLRLSGVIINSHTNDEYLSERKYWPILEAIAALDVPLYIHPRAPGPSMARAYRPDHLEHAIWGYQAETGLHALRLITGGVFDQFPNLKVVLGHMGEAIPYWLDRIDYMHKKSMIHMERPKLKRRPSDYFKHNFYITTSGVTWHPVLQFCISVLGADHIMFAIDYPYQDSAEAVALMNTAPISDEDKRRIFHKNAERVFHIKNEKSAAA
jgi:predicted TIM-barrel fold metal-dependent hydrolase